MPPSTSQPTVSPFRLSESSASAAAVGANTQKNNNKPLNQSDIAELSTVSFTNKDTGEAMDLSVLDAMNAKVTTFSVSGETAALPSLSKKVSSSSESQRGKRSSMNFLTPQVSTKGVKQRLSFLLNDKNSASKGGVNRELFSSASETMGKLTSERR